MLIESLNFNIKIMGSAIIKNITLNMTMGNKSFLRIMIMMLRQMVMLEYVFDIKKEKRGF